MTDLDENSHHAGSSGTLLVPDVFEATVKSSPHFSNVGAIRTPWDAYDEVLDLGLRGGGTVWCEIKQISE